MKTAKRLSVVLAKRDYGLTNGKESPDSAKKRRYSK